MTAQALPRRNTLASQGPRTNTTESVSGGNETFDERYGRLKEAFNTRGYGISQEEHEKNRADAKRDADESYEDKHNRLKRQFNERGFGITEEEFAKNRADAKRDADESYEDKHNRLKRQFNERGFGITEEEFAKNRADAKRDAEESFEEQYARHKKDYAGFGSDTAGSFSTNPGAAAAQLRADKVSSLRARSGTVSGVTIPELPAGTTTADESDELRRSVAADRFANSVRSPLRENFAGLYASLGEAAREEDAANTEFDEESAEVDYEAVERYIALQTQAEEDDRARLQLRALLERIKEQEKGKELKKALNDLKRWLQKRQTDAAAKGASLIDEGELLEIVDTIGVAVSTYQAVITIFQEVIPEGIKDRMSIPPLELGKSAADVASAAGTITQLMKWSIVVFILLPFAVILQVVLFASACDYLWSKVSFGSITCTEVWATVAEALSE